MDSRRRMDTGGQEQRNHPARIPHLVKTEKYIGASINYRLSGEAKWPSQIHDCKAAIRWLGAEMLKSTVSIKRRLRFGDLLLVGILRPCLE